MSVERDDANSCLLLTGKVLQGCTPSAKRGERNPQVARCTLDNLECSSPDCRRDASRSRLVAELLINASSETHFEAPESMCVTFKGATCDTQLIRLGEKQILLRTELAAS